VKIENTTKTADISPSDDAAPTTKFAPSISVLTLTHNRVQVSKQLQEIEPSAPGKAFDIKRVEALKQAISNGRFVIDSEKIADGLLETVHGLLPGKRR
jgi:negative regulator of flagellin synthesis FlgM